MSKEKRYRLLKDLPGVKADAIFTEDYGDDTYGYNSDNGEDCRIRRWNVEMFPQWFEEIKEPKQITFVGARWSDQKEFVDFELSNGFNYQISKERLAKFLMEDDGSGWSEKKEGSKSNAFDEWVKWRKNNPRPVYNPSKFVDLHKYDIGPIIREAEEKAFNAGREINGNYQLVPQCYRHKSFEDYKKQTKMP